MPRLTRPCLLAAILACLGNAIPAQVNTNAIDINQVPLHTADAELREMLELNGRVLSVSKTGVHSLDPVSGTVEHLSPRIQRFSGSPDLRKYGGKAYFLLTGYSGFDEAPDQVAYVRVATVTRVGVGDDKRAEVDLGSTAALVRAHTAA